MDIDLLGFPSTSADSLHLLLRPQRMTTDFYNSNLHMDQPPPECNCPPPPDLNWPPPPDPSLIFAELFPGESFEDFSDLNLNSECRMDFPSIVPVDLLPTEFEPMREYLAFLISAILAMVLVLIGAAICCVYLRRSGKCRSLFKLKSSEKTNSRDFISSADTSVVGSSTNQRRSDLTLNGRAPPVGTLRETKWSYNSMRPAPVNHRMTNQQPLHQASSLGLLMYGDDSMPNLASFQHHPVENGCRPPSSHTLPRQPRDLAPSKSLPAPYQRPHIPAAGGPIPHRQQQSHRNIAPYLETCQNGAVYEEIALKHGDPSYDSSQQCNIAGFRRPTRLPPPNLKPPPPPQGELDSPVSSGSCSCSADSTSLDQELDGIQITPSPKRKTDCAPVHQSSSGTAYDKAAYDKSTQSNASSPQDTTVSDCYECSNGRESGYGTEGRSKSSSSRAAGKFISPNLHRKQQKRGSLKSPTKQLWVSVKPSDLSPEKTANSSSNFRDSDDSAALAIFRSDKKSHSSHSMTYV